ncbi:MAG: Dihydrofolate reductase, partial [uncultured Nocardioidaceae bacterium]
AEADLRHERERGRLRRRARRRHQLGRAERRAVPVVVRPGGRDGRGAVRAQAVGDDELSLADRRPAAWRHPGGHRVRPSLAGHAEGGVLLHDHLRRLEHEPGHRRRGHRDHAAQGRGRRPDGHRRCHARRGGHAGRPDRRVRVGHRTGPGGQRHAVLHGAGRPGEPGPGGDPGVPWRRGAHAVRDQAL